MRGYAAPSDAKQERAASVDPLRTRMPAARDAQKQGDQVIVASDHWSGEFDQLQLISSSADTKFAWGNRITLPSEITPFTIEGTVALTIEATSGGAPSGLQVGDPIEFLVFADASASGVFSNAKLVYRQNDTFKTFNPDNPTLDDIFYPFTTPVTVKQGDVYIIMVDRTTDTGDNTGTVVPYILPEDGGTNFDRSFMARVGDALNPASYRTLENTFTDGPQGEFVIRLVGEQTSNDTPATNDFEPVDNAAPAPANLTGTSTGLGGTLSWSAPNLPPPTITDVAEQEPNDSPASAQNAGVNVKIAGADRSTNNGAPGGFGDDDVEDWYGFTLAVPTVVTIDLTDFGNTDFDLLLYTTAGPFNSDEAVATSGNGAGDDEHIELLLPAGSYVVAVTPFDPDVPANTNYNLQIVAAPKVLRYNIYCGVGAVTVSEEDFFGTAGGEATSFTIEKTTPGSSYVVTAVLGASQSGPSNSASLGACEGGPTVTSAKLKLKKNGKLTLNGAGFVPGMTILINGSQAGANVKIKKNGTLLKLKGPLANGQPYSSVITSGQEYTVTIITPAGGCSAATFTAP